MRSGEEGGKRGKDLLLKHKGPAEAAREGIVGTAVTPGDIKLGDSHRLKRIISLN